VSTTRKGQPHEAVGLMEEAITLHLEGGEYWVVVLVAPRVAEAGLSLHREP
jgi:hypothetical protein